MLGNAFSDTEGVIISGRNGREFVEDLPHDQWNLGLDGLLDTLCSQWRPSSIRQ